MRRTILVSMAVLLGACSAKPACEAGPRVYEARGIGQQWIDYVWVELVPAPLGALQNPAGSSTGMRDGGSTPPPATVPGRLFVASADPVEAIIPTMIDLPCAGGPVEYAPAPVEFAVEAGTAPAGAPRVGQRDLRQYGRWSPDAPSPERLKTSYEWGSCAACSECYMRWTFSLDLEGQLEGDALVADLVLNETFHSGPMPIVSVRMEDVTAACTEPRLRCEAGGECGRLRFEGRK